MNYQRHKAANFIYKQLMSIGEWLQELPNKATPHPFRLLQIGSAYWQSRTLYLAASLDLATMLGDEVLSAQELAARTHVDADSLRRVLRLLGAIGVFEEASSGLYKNNALSNYLRQGFPNNVRAMILLHNSEEMSRPWYEKLESAVRDGGIPFQQVHGEELFDYLDQHRELDELFSNAMESVEALVGDSFATDFNWGEFDRVIDVGGSKGSKSLAILKHWPALEALIFDRPSVIETACVSTSNMAPASVRARLSWESGNMFEAVPIAHSHKDIYLLCAVLHGLNDNSAIKVLQRVRAACGDSGARIAVMEMVLPSGQVDLARASFDMQMFVGTQGRERTLEEWHRLFGLAGLSLEAQIELRSLGKILLLQSQ